MGCKRPLQQSSQFTHPLSLCPRWWGQKKDHQKAWARRCFFIGAGVVPQEGGPQDPQEDPCPRLLPPARDTVSQGHFFHQLLQKEREKDATGSLGLRHRLDRDF